jgi:hypothetical protein
VKKHQNTLTQDIEAKILSMYAKGMGTGDIEHHVQDLYGIEMSDTTISRVTDKILPVCILQGLKTPYGGPKKGLCCTYRGNGPF